MKKWFLVTVLPAILFGLLLLTIIASLINVLNVTTSTAANCDTSSGSVNISNKNTEENAKAIYDYLRSRENATAEGAAGIMGTMDFESGGFNPAITNPSSGAYGLAQWLGGRKTALQSFAQSKGKEMSNLGVQLEFLSEELKNPYYAKAKKALKSTNIHEAQKEWLLWFEGLSQDSSQWHLTQRNALADKWYAKFGANDPMTGSAIGNVVDGQLQDISAICGSTGVADEDIVTAAKKYLGWFHYPNPIAHSLSMIGGNPQSPNKEGYTDCSGFVWLALENAGYNVPANMGWFTGTMSADAKSTKQWLQVISQIEAGVGDIVIVNVGGGSGSSGHTAILEEPFRGGNTKIIQMGGNGDVVNEDTFNNSFMSLLNAGEVTFARAIKK